MSKIEAYKQMNDKDPKWETYLGNLYSLKTYFLSIFQKKIDNVNGLYFCYKQKENHSHLLEQNETLE